MKKIFLLCLFSCLGISYAANHNVIDSLLLQLDQTIEKRPLYIMQKERYMGELKKQLRQASVDERRFALLGKLLDGYRSYNADSSLFIAKARYQLAIQMKKQEYINNARMNMAEIMGGVAGMYKESIDMMNTIRVSQLPEYLHPYYYHVYRISYGLMADYAITEQEKKNYTEITSHYRDSLLLVNKNNHLIYTIIQSDQYNVKGEYDRTIALLSYYMQHNLYDEHNLAILAYTLSESYRLKGDRLNEKKFLIISAIGDMKSAVREYVSLRKLAVLLYYEGDIDRAYSYLKLCMDDAVFCNARLRMLEILKIFPIINDTYQKKIEKQQRNMQVALISISILSLFLVLAVFYVYKQMKRVAAARREVMDVNIRLKELNDELNYSNVQLKDANRSIAENSYLKEEYIGRYMDMCSIYLEKMDNYRRSLGKIASTGKVEELYKYIKSTKLIDEELSGFYENFDNTFLQLFPTFVEDFNMLLANGEQIHPRGNERMNTELRIFALIRLGITDSVKIAQFLRYSVTTIYNYRTKVRNKAKGDRELLEVEVLKIGKLKE
jgi:cell division protein FtsL